MRRRSGMLISITAVLLMIIMLSSCMGRENFIQSVMLTSDVRGAYIIDPADHYSVFEKHQLILSSGDCELYFDKKTGNIGVYDKKSGELWSALPTFANRSAAVITAEAFNGTATYILNSQDHAAAFNTVTSERDGNTIRVFFAMADKEETADKKPEELTAGDIYVGIPLEITFDGSRLSASVDMAQVVVAPGLILYNIGILPYFGAADNDKERLVPGGTPSSNAADDGFILVPDGCGAAVSTGKTSLRYPELDFCVYGSDDSFGREACLNVFGMKRGNAAFVCVGTEGEELAVVKTMRSTDNTGSCCIVYADYNVTPVFNNNGCMIYGLMYGGKIRQTYGFVNGRSADTAGMAAAAREILALADKINVSRVNGSLPVNIALTGSVDGKKETLLTTFEQAEAVLSQMKAKGAAKVNLILNGFYEGGAVSGSVRSGRLSSFTGNKEKFSSLCEYARRQDYDLFMGVNMITTAGRTAGSLGIDGSSTEYIYNNPLVPVGSEIYMLKRIAPRVINDDISRFLGSSPADGAAGYAFTDTNRSLSADYSMRLWSRSAVADLLSGAADSFSSGKKLLVSGGGFYLLRGASVITDIPYYTSVTPGDGYEAVPFIQMILHSSYIYSGKAVCGAESDRTELLKAVEYGGVPYFSWTGSRSEYNYEPFISSAAEFARNMAQELGDLSSARITGHRKLTEGVYRTEYDNGALVYVNYNDHPVTAEHIDIPAVDYIRIN